MGTRERYFPAVNFNPALLISICGNRIGGYDFSRALAFLGMLLISHKSPPLVVACDSHRFKNASGNQDMRSMCDVWQR